MGRTLLVVAVLVVSGCQCGGGRVTPAVPLAEAQPLALDFGPVPVGLSARLPFRLSNVGVRDLTVNRVTAMAPFSLGATPTLVVSGERVDIEVTFSPTAEGTFTSAATVVSDADNDPSLEVTLTGQGVSRTVCAPCTMPPMAFCTVSNTLVVYANIGSCLDGRCQYEAATIPCSGTCNAQRALCEAPDAGSGDAGAVDAGPPDAGAFDAGSYDAGFPDAGSTADAGQGCVGLDPRPDLNANGVPDCAENLLRNGQFPSGSTSPWTSTNRGTIVSSATDELGLATSGSGRVANTVMGTSLNSGGVMSECVAVTPGVTYSVYLRYFLASGQPGGDANASVWSVLHTYSDGACAVSQSAVSGGVLGATKDAWGLNVRTYQMTPNDRSIRVELGVLKGPTSSDVSALFDNVLLVAQ